MLEQQAGLTRVSIQQTLVDYDGGVIVSTQAECRLLKGLNRLGRLIRAGLNGRRAFGPPLRRCDQQYHALHELHAANHTPLP